LDSYENAAVIVSGIHVDQLGHPTPCPKYDAAGLIDHLVEAATARVEKEVRTHPDAATGREALALLDEVRQIGLFYEGSI
jgi:hypothetical protein